MIDMKQVEKAYKRQISTCRNKLDKLGNPVEMRMSLQQFADIWHQSGKWHLRGKGKGKYCMARHNDIGHYEWHNVSIIPFEENSSEAHKGKPKSINQKTKMSSAKKGRPSPFKGKPLSEEHKANMRKPKIKSQCQHCGMWVANHLVNRYHNDNCKKKPPLRGQS